MSEPEMLAVILRAPWTYGDPPQPEPLGYAPGVAEARADAVKIAERADLTGLSWRQSSPDVWDLMSGTRTTDFVVRWMTRQAYLELLEAQS
jgi:hypothetical protein